LKILDCRAFYKYKATNDRWAFVLVMSMIKRVEYLNKEFLCRDQIGTNSFLRLRTYIPRAGHVTG
ncbi:MAG: hypothetical protein WDZ40_02005, partial [Candidatus Spechtbacterales bacterium]